MHMSAVRLQFNSATLLAETLYYVILLLYIYNQKFGSESFDNFKTHNTCETGDGVGLRNVGLPQQCDVAVNLGMFY
jgi:hypothetical protein